MTSRNSKNELAALIAATLLASAGQAQNGPSLRDGDGPPPQALQQQRENDLALLLDLTPAQQGLMHAFLASMQRPGEGPGEPPDRAGLGPMRPDGPGRPDSRDEARSFAERLARMEADLDHRTSEERARIKAARVFYTALDARQQQKFEAIERMRHGLHDDPPGPHHGGPQGHDGPGGGGPDRGPGQDGRDGPPPDGNAPPPPGHP